MKYILPPDVGITARKLMKSPQNLRHYRRLEVIALRAEGFLLKDMVQITGFNMRTLSNILKRFSTSGFEALEDHHTGHHYKVSKAAVDNFLKGYTKQSENAELLSVKAMWLDFQETFNVTYTLEAFYLLLKRHGWRKVRPRPEHPKKASADEINASKKLTL